MDNLTDRQKREKEYYEEYAKKFAMNAICFDPIEGHEQRPWNSYWALYAVAKDAFKTPRQRLLEMGCGSGQASIVLAKIGYEVFGFDISENNIRQAGEFARQYELQDRIHFSTGVTEKVDAPDEHFDLIVGIDILHHIDIAATIKECHRVLKKGGKAIFREPVEVPFWDWLRNRSLIRRMVPNEKSFEWHITEDERKLAASDLRMIRGLFPDCQIQRFNFLSRFDRFIRKPGDLTPSGLEKLDFRLFKTFPGLKAWGGSALIVVKK